MKKTYLAMLCVAVSMGCGESGSGGGGRRDAASALGCVDILTCVDACTKTSCIEACLEAGSPSAVAQVSALVECSETAACGDDDDCIAAQCPTELAACEGTVLHDGGLIVRDGAVRDGDVDASSPLPSRIEGTSRDFTPFPGTTTTFDSNASLVFVRDDVAGAAAGFPTSILAFYRLEQIEYHAVMQGTDGCATFGESTETFTNPDPFENHLTIELEPGPDGLHAYEVSTTLSVNYPTGLVVTCPPPIPSSSGHFNSEHNLTSGTSHPRTNGTDFVGTAMVSFRQFSWDLHSVD